MAPIETHHVSLLPNHYSKGTRIGCWNASYEALTRQMEAAGLSPWNNRWSEVSA